MLATELKGLIVDDDAAYRRILSQSLQRLGVAEVGLAPDLALARSKIERERPDFVTIDVVMRGESGLELLSWIRRHHRHTATILVTSGSEHTACKDVDALLLGATALVLKPSGVDAPARLDASLSQILSGICGTRVSAVSAPVADRVLSQSLGLSRARRSLIAIGASTGGPPVVLSILSDLPRPLVTPIVITQHMPAPHMPHYAALLRERTGLPVRLAEHGEAVKAGQVYVAPGGLHLLIERSGNDLILRTDAGPEEHNCRPAVDPMFRSVAASCGSACLGVVLTGMGSDGAEGAVTLRQGGAPVVIQDRESSVVWGMPGAVAARGAASVSAAAGDIAQWIAALDISMLDSGRLA